MESPRASARLVGIVIAAVAAWGGVVAYVGPTFDFNLGSTTRAWVWSQSHTTLHLGPGICGLVGGLLLVLGGWRLARLGAVLGIVSGAWFLVGPTIEPLWQANGDTSGTTGSAGSTSMRVLEGIGYHYGTGLVLVLLSALALGLLARPRVVEAMPAPTEPAEAETIVSPGPEPAEEQLVYRHPSHA